MFTRKVHMHWRSLHGMAWQQFVAEVFRAKGYWVREVDGQGDDGIDLIATMDDQRIAIQCKGGVREIDAAAVRQAISGQVIHGCTRAAVVTNSGFNEQAKRLAKSSQCWLVDAAEFAQLAGDRQLVVKPSRPSIVWKLIGSVWTLLVRLVGMTFAVVLLTLGVAVTVFIGYLIVARLDLPTPAHQQLELPELPASLPAEDAAPVEPEEQTLPADSREESPPTLVRPENKDRYAPARREPTERPREWQLGDGTITATYLGFEDGKVQLWRTDRDEQITVSLDNLGEVDKKVVAARIRRARREERQREQAAAADADPAEEVIRSKAD